MKKIILLFALLVLPALHAHASYYDDGYIHEDPQYYNNNYNYAPTQIVQSGSVNYYPGYGYAQAGTTQYYNPAPVNYYPGYYAGTQPYYDNHAGYGYTQTQIVSTQNMATYGYYQANYPYPQPQQFSNVNYYNSPCGYNNCPCPHPYW